MRDSDRGEVGSLGAGRAAGRGSGHVGAVVRRSAAPAHDAEGANHRLPSGHTCGQETSVSIAFIKRDVRDHERHVVHPTRQRAGQRARMWHVSQRHRRRPVNHKVVGDRLAVVLHLRTEHALTHEVHGAHHEQRHYHAHDGADGVVGRRRRLLRRI